MRQPIHSSPYAEGIFLAESRKGQTGPVQTARKTDGSGHNPKKDSWVRSQLEERQMGPVQTAGMTVRAGSVPLSDVAWPYLSPWAGDDDESAGKTRRANFCPS